MRAELAGKIAPTRATLERELTDKIESEKLDRNLQTYSDAYNFHK